MKPEESKLDCLKSADIYYSTFHPVVGRITAPQRCLHPNSLEL